MPRLLCASALGGVSQRDYRGGKWPQQCTWTWPPKEIGIQGVNNATFQYDCITKGLGTSIFRKKNKTIILRHSDFLVLQFNQQATHILNGTDNIVLIADSYPVTGSSSKQQDGN